jgi:hypothetical protein
MQFSKLILLLTTSAFLVSSSANAGEINIRAGQVTVTTHADGSIDIHTGLTPFRDFPARSYGPMHRSSSEYLRQNSLYCRSNISRQESTQSTRTGRTFQQTYFSSDRCR